MLVNVQSIHFDADQKLLDFINRKIAKIEKVYSNATETEVFLKLDGGNGNTHEKVTEIKVHIPGTVVFAREQGPNFEHSLEQALDGVVNQLRRWKGRRNAAQ